MQELMPTPREVDVRSAVEHIAVFVSSARPEHLRTDARQLFKRNILDSLGCAIAGLRGRPFQALRKQLEEYRTPGRCALTSPDSPIMVRRNRTSSLIDFGEACSFRRAVWYARTVVSSISIRSFSPRWRTT